MGKRQATVRIKNKARVMREQDGMSYPAIGDALGFNQSTISKWAKDGGWVKGEPVDAIPTPDLEVPDPPDYAPSFPVPGPQDHAPPSASDPFEPSIVTNPMPEQRSETEVELRARIAELESTLDTTQAELDKHRPTRNIDQFLTDRITWLEENTPEGKDYWVRRAEAEFSAENKQRAKEGFPPFNLRENPEILDDIVIRLKTKEKAAMQHGEPAEPPTRRVKLIIDRNGVPTIEQIPLEGQINNTKGSLADGIVRYTRKGFKLTDPFLCPRAGCFRPAGLDARNEWQFDGYCSQLHRDQVEGTGHSATMAGLQTRDVVSSGSF